jgi:hypothetical protein
MATATGPAAPPVEMPAELLIDRYLPRYDVGRIEHTSPRRIWPRPGRRCASSTWRRSTPR